MFKIFKNIINNAVDALSTKPVGFSARKLTAFITVLCIIFIHYKYTDSANAVTILIYDMLFVLLLLGIVTIDQLYRFKNGGSTNSGEKIDNVENNIGNLPTQSGSTMDNQAVK